MLKKLSVLAGTAALAMSLMLLSGCGGDTVPTGGNGGDHRQRGRNHDDSIADGSH